MYDENLEFDRYDEEYEQWLDEMYAAADAAIEAGRQFEHDLNETAKMLAGGLI